MVSSGAEDLLAVVDPSRADALLTAHRPQLTDQKISRLMNFLGFFLKSAVRESTRVSRRRMSL